ncbi:MAG: ribosome biogenesis GTPase Der [Gammaproteobacteria bacterium]|nr:ribosome biogenesis GTPase Der [Gammaproteobacteria bacterium]
MLAFAPVIALVGRPNVGKSTLFNRLTQSRAALVSDFPGMTRDRQYGEALLDDQPFILIDTGGITDEKENIDQLVTEQSRLAIAEADVILFIVDARAHLTVADLEIANILRLTQKNILVVVNKAEGMESEIATADFFQLGFQHPPLAISAEHNGGITDLTDTIKALTPPEKMQQDALEKMSGIRLAIVGRPNVGKSTLTNRILGEERVIVCDQPGTTRDSIFIPMKRLDQDYTLIDTAGVRRRGRVFEAIEKFSVVKTLQAIDAAQVVIFVMDAREGVTEQDLRLLGFVIENGKALVLAINKWDGLTEDDKNKARASIDRRLDFIPYVRIHYISALHGSGVGNLFDSIQEAYKSANIKMTTPRLTRILEDAVTQHSPPLVQGRRIKMRYAHPGGNFPPCIIIHGNQLDALPDAYRRYLANTFQSKLKLVGTPVRIQFKYGDNPFGNRKNKLTPRQQHKKKRLMRHVKKKK